MSVTIVLRNWCSTKSFSGRPARRVSRSSHAEVAFTSAARTRPITPAGTCLGPTRHSGSRASPTQGYSSAQAHRFATSREAGAARLEVEQQDRAVAVSGVDVPLHASRPMSWL